MKGLGVKNITILSREPLITLNKDDDKAVTVIGNAAIRKLIGEGRSLTGIEYADLTSRTADSAEIKTIPARNLFIASGRFPELIFRKTDDSKSVKWEAFEPYKKPECKEEIGFFAEGDVQTDYSAAIRAIGAGRRAAASIHQVMYNMPLGSDDAVLTCCTVIQDVDRIDNVKAKPRTITPLADVRELAKTGESEKGFTEKMAHSEANRCLQCGLICYERS